MSDRPACFYCQKPIQQWERADWFVVTDEFNPTGTTKGISLPIHAQRCVERFFGLPHADQTAIVDNAAAGASADDTVELRSSNTPPNPED